MEYNNAVRFDNNSLFMIMYFKIFVLGMVASTFNLLPEKVVLQINPAGKVPIAHDELNLIIA